MTNVTAGANAQNPVQLEPIPDFGKEGWSRQFANRLDTGHGKRFKLEIEYSPALDQYRWSVVSKVGDWTGFEKTFDLALDTACQVYADYRQEVDAE